MKLKVFLMEIVVANFCLIERLSKFVCRVVFEKEISNFFSFFVLFT